MNIASHIDHTFLKPGATSSDIQNLCEEALLYKFAGVCVNSRFAEQVAQLLRGTSVLCVVVVGFPLGACLTEIKAQEAALAVKKGAQEIDMVISIGAIKEDKWDEVEADISAVVQAAKVPVKVILETAFLTENEIVKACLVSKKAGAAFVKTCTGFGGGGATEEHIRLMRKTVGPDLGVKASGGIKSREQALLLLKAGADRLGTSSGVILVENGKAEAGGY